MAAGSLKLPQGNHAGCLSTTLAWTSKHGGTYLSVRPVAMALFSIASRQERSFSRFKASHIRAHGQAREKENIQRNKKALATSSPPYRRNFWAHLAATIHNCPLQSVTTTPVHI